MGTEAGHINDNEEKQLVPGYGTIAIGLVQSERIILGDITPKGRQRYVFYVPSDCGNLPAGTKVMYDVQALSLPGNFPPIEVAINVKPFDYEVWYKDNDSQK